MAVSEEDVMSLSQGDQIVIISEDEAKSKRLWYGEVASWAIDMNKYCSNALTVSSVRKERGYGHVYVEENLFWWKADFIDSIIKAPRVSYSSEDIEFVLFGGV